MKNLSLFLAYFFLVFVLLPLMAYSSTEVTQGEQSSVIAPVTTLHTSNVEIQSREQLWRISPTLGVPFRGFEIQTGARTPGTQDPIGSISYSQSPSLEGTVSLSYKDFGFTYRHTLASSNLDSASGSSSSTSEEFSFSLLLTNQLVEASRENLVGLQTDLDVDNSGVKRRIARSDIKFTDMRLRWIYGLPIWGADTPNSLANFYTKASIPKGQEVSIDLLVGAEMSQQSISGSYSFVPPERQAVFGASSTLSKVSASGAGVGAGVGLTALMTGKSYFSIAGLVGGNYNFTRSDFGDHVEDTSDFGAYLNARMSVEFVFGENDSQNIGFRLFANSLSIPAKDVKVAFTDANMSLNYGVNF